MALFGIFPAIVTYFLLKVNVQELGFGSQDITVSLRYYFPLGLLAIIINMFAASKPANLAVYPQMKIPVWTPYIFLFNAVCWGAYLLAYEFLFRGVLLFLCLPALGTVNAIAINAAIYALVHIPKGFRETLGAILFGIILCIITLRTGTIWCAFLTHFTLALSNDLWSVYYSKKFSFIWSRTRVNDRV